MSTKLTEKMRDGATLTLVQAEFHRNGCSGNGFQAILFDWDERGKIQRMLGVLFDEPGSCAVMRTEPLSKDDGVTFGENSYRGDNFEPALRKLVSRCETGRFGPFSIPSILRKKE